MGGHGFLIVGWGPAEDIQASVNAVVLGQPSGGRVSFSLDKQVNSVPYVADFAYGFDGSKTGWLQDVRPRPFYVSAANTSLSYFDPVVVGYSASDYSSRLRGNFGAFIYKDNGSCSGTDCRPDW